jgi:hypothetical protein
MERQTVKDDGPVAKDEGGEDDNDVPVLEPYSYAVLCSIVCEKEGGEAGEGG